MAKHAKPYLQCEKRDGTLVLTVMAGGANGHILKGRKTIMADDPVLLATTLKKLMHEARGWTTPQEKQAYGNR